jgi:hypothetical protein
VKIQGHGAPGARQTAEHMAFAIFPVSSGNLYIMRVGRPVQALPHPNCDYCGAKATLVRPGEAAYPYQDGHGPLWLCAPCEAWIGVFARSTRNLPLGRLANAELREWKAKLHAALEPMAETKARRDGVSIFEARSKGYKWLAGELKIEPKACNINLLDLEHCKAAVGVIEQFEQNRRAATPSE